MSHPHSAEAPPPVVTSGDPADDPPEVVGADGVVVVVVVVTGPDDAPDVVAISTELTMRAAPATALTAMEFPLLLARLPMTPPQR